MNTLVFVYNANSGIKNLAIDIAHKLFSPKTYNCNLCALTFNTFSENTIWKDFRKRTYLTIEFLHIDEFETNYPNQNFSYPIILKKDEGKLEAFLSKEAINHLSTIEELILAIDAQTNGLMR